MDVVRSIAMAFLLAGGVVVGGAQAASSIATGDENAEVWRAGPSDGLNCFYLTLTHFGCQVDYGTAKERLHRNGHAPSMADLQAVAGEFGLPMRAIGCRPDQIAALPMPAIVHMDSKGEGRGEFVLLLHVDQSRVLYLNGGLVTYADMSWDDFRRTWSGYVLIADSARMSDKRAIVAGIGLVALFYSVLQLRRHARG